MRGHARVASRPRRTRRARTRCACPSLGAADIARCARWWPGAREKPGSGGFGEPSTLRTSGKIVRQPGQCRKALQVIFHAVGQARAEHLLHGKRCVVGFLSHAKSFSSRGGAQDAPGHAAFTAVLAFLKERDYVTVAPSPGQLRCSFFEPAACFPSFDEPLDRVLVSRTPLVAIRISKELGKQALSQKSFTPEQAAHIADMERRVAAINEHSLGFRYHVFERGRYHELPQTSATYHVPYNDESTRRGGRLYCAIQNLPQRSRAGDPQFRPLRSTLHIDGKPTAEVDFSSLHPRMLYNMRGLPCPDRCYQIPVHGWNVSNDDPVKLEFMKLVLLALPNCGKASNGARKNRRAGIQTIERRLTEFNETQDAAFKVEHADLLPCFGIFYDGPADDYPNALAIRRAYKVPPSVTPEAVLDAVLQHHAEIADLLYQGVGTYLQSVDARIMLRIIERFNALGRPIVTVHDSCRVWAEDVGLAQQIMTEEYVREFPGFPPRFKIDVPPPWLPPFPA